MQLPGLETLAAILMLAALGEGIIEAIKPALRPLAEKAPEGIDIYLYVSIVLGLVLALAWDADIFVILGLTTSIPYVGSVLTGLLIGRGANYVHNLFTNINPPGAILEAVIEPATKE